MSAKQIIRLNASSLKEATCIRRLWFKIIDGYKTKRDKVEPIYGIAFHKVTETLALTKDESEAVLAGQSYLQNRLNDGLDIPKGKDYLEVFHLTRSAQAYLAALKTEAMFTGTELLINPQTQLPLVEQQFSIPIYADDNYEFLLQGTIDRFVRIRGGCLCIEDFKTTASKDKAAYLSGYKLSHQLRTYVFAVRMLAELYPDNPIAGHLKGNPTIGARVLGVFLDPKEPTSFAASDVFYEKDMNLPDYYQWLKGLCVELASCLEYNKSTGKLPWAEGEFNGQCQTPFGSGCAFANLCASLPAIGLDAVRALAARSFKQVLPYEPLKVGGGKEI